MGAGTQTQSTYGVSGARNYRANLRDFKAAECFVFAFGEGAWSSTKTTTENNLSSQEYLVSPELSYS